MYSVDQSKARQSGNPVLDHEQKPDQGARRLLWEQDMYKVILRSLDVHFDVDFSYQMESGVCSFHKYRLNRPVNADIRGWRDC